MGWFAFLTSTLCNARGQTHGLPSINNRVAPTCAHLPALPDRASTSKCHNVSDRVQVSEPAPLTPEADPPLTVLSQRPPLPLKLKTSNDHTDAMPARRRSTRLVISGRMADVCEELERMVAAEAAPRNTLFQ